MVNRIPLKNNIRKLRYENGEITQEELAEKIGVTRQTIASMEQGKYSPTLVTAFRVARVFGVSLEEVFTWDDEIE